jgi:hypothetical protein
MFDRTEQKPRKKKRGGTMNNSEMPEIANRPKRAGSPSRHAPDGAVRLLEEYEARLAVARERFDRHPTVRALFRDPIDL